jgi:hypothetical protein
MASFDCLDKNANAASCSSDTDCCSNLCLLGACLWPNAQASATCLYNPGYGYQTVGYGYAEVDLAGSIKTDARVDASKWDQPGSCDSGWITGMTASCQYIEYSAGEYWISKITNVGTGGVAAELDFCGGGSCLLTVKCSTTTSPAWQ